MHVLAIIGLVWLGIGVCTIVAGCIAAASHISKVPTRVINEDSPEYLVFIAQSHEGK